MLTRHALYFGLLACLVALLALGSLPVRIDKLAADQRGPAEQAPGEEPGDEERESEQESKEVFPLRRRIAVWHNAKAESRFFQAVSAQSSSGVSRFVLTRLAAELAAR